MLSYHNDENLKKLIVCEMRKHQEQDQFVKNTYGREECGKFNGCAVGCAIDSINIALGKRYRSCDHKVFEEALGIPEFLAHLQDSFFERLPIGENSQFAVDFLEAIPVGVNLESVKYKFCSFLMSECLERVIKLPYLSISLREQVMSAIRGVRDMYDKAIETGVLEHKEDSSEEVLSDAAFSAARSARSAAADTAFYAARSAAADAAFYAARSAAADAAFSAARSARSAAADAAFSAARSARSAAADAAFSDAWPSAMAAADSADAACSAARSSAMAAARSACSAARGESDAYKRYSMELIRLLKEAK